MQLFLAAPESGSLAPQRSVASAHWAGWHSLPPLRRCPTGAILALAAERGVSILLLTFILPSSSVEEASQVANLFKALQQQILKQHLPLQLHACGELNLGLSRANTRAEAARAVVPEGPLFVVVSSSSTATWISRPRLYITTWPLVAGGALVGVRGGTPPSVSTTAPNRSTMEVLRWSQPFSQRGRPKNSGVSLQRKTDGDSHSQQHRPVGNRRLRLTASRLCPYG